MQQTIGERLQQARQRIGLSLDEVSDKLKIRKDWIIKFEANEFDSKLPAVYAKGFLRSYVRFLKLNENVILSEYDAIHNEEQTSNRISLGHLRIENLEEKTDKIGPQISNLDLQESSAKYVKPIFQFVYFKKLIWVVVVGIFLGIICLIFNHFKKEEKAATTSWEKETLYVPVTQEPKYEEITLVALDTVQVFVRQEKDKKRLFAGTLNKDERRPIAKEDVLQISYSEGNNLLIERADGSTIRPQKPGRGWTKVQ